MNIAPVRQGAEVAVAVPKGLGWQHARRNDIEVWLKGHPYGVDAGTVAGWLAGSDDPAGKFARHLGDTDGHFAILARTGDAVLAAVDRTRSIPVFYCPQNDSLEIAADWRQLAGLDRRNIDPEAALAIAMSGYTIGTDTLFRDLRQLGPGELLVATGDGQVSRLAWHRYEPWKIAPGPAAARQEQLGEVTLEILRRMADSAAGRTIHIPLSAGLDSRLIAAGLRHLGIDNVRCFSYGIPGNHEAVAGRRIARELGYDWRFIPLTPPVQRDFFRSAACRDYLRFADSACSTTVTHELPVVMRLLDDGFMQPGDIVVNGNSGDFISGLHLAPALRRPRDDLDPSGRRRLVIHCLVEKHFRLWRALGMPENDARIAARLDREADACDGAENDPETAHGLHERLEFQDRQSKYVISRQRLYEFAGLDWRLPLWEGLYLDFWAGVPLAEKAGQALYRRMLTDRNWGGVWQDPAWTVPQRVVPAWIRAPRLLAKLLHAPLGRDRWHQSERRLFGYWMDPIAGTAIVPPLRVLADGRGARHFVAWHTEAWLREKGLAWNGAPSDGAAG